MQQDDGYKAAANLRPLAFKYFYKYKPKTLPLLKLQIRR